MTPFPLVHLLQIARSLHYPCRSAKGSSPSVRFGEMRMTAQGLRPNDLRRGTAAR